MASTSGTDGSLKRCILARINVPITDSYDDESEVVNVWDSLVGKAPKVDWAVGNNIHFENQSYLDTTAMTRNYALVAFMSDEQLTEFLLRFE